MNRKERLADYLSVAAVFQRHGALVELVDCAGRILRLDASSEAGRRLLASAADLKHVPNPTPAQVQELRRARRVKAKLDALLDREATFRASALDSLRVDPPKDDTPPPDSGRDGQLEALSRLVHRLRKRVARPPNPSGTPPTASTALLALLDRLAESLPQPADAIGAESASEPGKAEPAAERDHEAWWGELSLQHEIHNLGNEVYKLERFKDAVDVYTATLELDPDLLETYFNRGLAYTRLQMYDRACEDLDRVIELNPNLAEAYYTRGLVMEYKQDYDAAEADHVKALEVDPKYRKAETQLEVVRGKKRACDSGPSSSANTTGGRQDDHDRITSWAEHRLKPDTTFADVGGNVEAKRRLRIVTEFFRGNPAIEEWGGEPPRGVLLYGPPGTGKTLLASALAGECRVPFYKVCATDFLNLYYGNTEANMRALWAEAETHPQGTIIFIDEFEALGSVRSDLRNPRGDDCHNKAVACLLELIGGMKDKESRLVVVAATNRLDNVDEGFAERTGRFNYKVEVGPPDVRACAEIWIIHLARAEERTDRVDFLAEDLRRPLRADRAEWLARAGARRDGDEHPILTLARRSARHGLVGDDIREVVRRTVEERIMAAIEWKTDVGPIGASDLLHQLDYFVESRRAPEDDPGERNGDSSLLA